VLRHPVWVAAALIALTGANAALQPNGITPMVIKDSLEKESPALQAWNSHSRVRIDQDSEGSRRCGGRRRPRRMSPCRNGR